MDRRYPAASCRSAQTNTAQEDFKAFFSDGGGVQEEEEAYEGKLEEEEVGGCGGSECRKGENCPEIKPDGIFERSPT